MESFCSAVSRSRCSLLDEKCFRLKIKRQCEFLGHYNLLRSFPRGRPISKKVKKNMLEPFLDSWRDFARNPKPGRKNMTGGPLEDTIRETLGDELKKCGVNVWPAMKYDISEGLCYLPDIKITKDGHPHSPISIKTWLGPGSIRETFASSYFAKLWHGHKNLNIYMVTLHLSLQA
jgi:hypothetical protein